MPINIFVIKFLSLFSINFWKPIEIGIRIKYIIILNNVSKFENIKNFYSG